MSTACYLAKAGYRVTVLEKNDSAGGRARVFESNGFVFDMGPSWYWMPDVFEKFFADFGKKVSDYYAADAESMADNEPTRVGMDAIKAGIKKDMDADTAGHTVTFATTGVWAAGNYATETGTSKVTDKEGKVVRTGKYMTLFELRDGKYIAIRDMWNSDAPPAAAAAPAAAPQ